MFDETTSMKYDLSIIIPSRNEEFLKITIDDILSKIEGNTEVIAILDGVWASPAIPDHPRVTIIYHSESIGQRRATNEGVKLSQAKYIMKSDAHMLFDQGFDVKAMKPYNDGELGHDCTQIFRMYNLHAFDWVCNKCGQAKYQGPTPGSLNKKGEVEPGCEKCDNPDDFTRKIIWKERRHKQTDFTRMEIEEDGSLRFKYWGSYKDRPEAKEKYPDVMCNLGACWFMERSRYWEIGGLDESHGSWGQMGIEISCKSFLSGGRQVVNRDTWYSHLFRTQGGDFSMPWPQSGNQVANARKVSTNLWLNNGWDKAIHRFSWFTNKFRPPGFATKGIIYYTDSELDEEIAVKCRDQLLKSELPIVSTSLKPLDFGTNITMDLERGKLTMFKQILAALEESTADVIFFCEHDVMYHPTHFDFIPPERDVYYYNLNIWKVDWPITKALHYDCKQTSGLCGYRETLITHYKERIRRVETDGHTNKMGYEPGSHHRKERIDDLKSETWESEVCNIDIRHDNNLTPSRWRKDQFRSQKNCRNWQEADKPPGWSEF